MSTPSCKLPFAFVCAGFFTVVMMISLPVFAQITKSQRAKEVEAKKACLAGKSYYEKGIELLAELFAETNEPNYIYNQGRCFQQNRQPEQALDRFQEYLRREPKMTPKEEATLETYMRECEALIAKMQPPVASPTPSTPTILPPPVLVVEQPVKPNQTEPATSGLRTAGVVTSVFGLAAVGAGVFCYLKTDSLTNQLNKRDGWDQEKANSRDSYERLGYISFGVGASVFVIGTTLYLLGRPAEKPIGNGTSVSIVPTFGRGTARLFLRGVY